MPSNTLPRTRIEHLLWKIQYFIYDGTDINIYYMRGDAVMIYILFGINHEVNFAPI